LRGKIRSLERIRQIEALFALAKTFAGIILGITFGLWFSYGILIIVGWIISIAVIIVIAFLAKTFTILSQHSLKTLCLRHGTFSYFITILLFWGIAYTYF